MESLRRRTSAPLACRRKGLPPTRPAGDPCSDVIEPTHASNLRGYGRLSFLFKGAKIEGWETPAELSMVDGDVIICCRAAVVVMAAGTILSTQEPSPTFTEGDSQYESQIVARLPEITQALYDPSESVQEEATREFRRLL